MKICFSTSLERKSMDEEWKNESGDTGRFMNSSKSKTGLFTSWQQDQDLRPSWNTW